MIRLDSIGTQQAERIAAMDVGQDDLVLLDRNRAFLMTLLPDALADSTRQFSKWPGLQEAMAIQEVHEARVSHWSRLLNGRIGEGYRESANRLATVFHRNGLSAFSATICHAVVLRVLAERVAAGAGGHGVIGRRSAEAERRALQDALGKLVWLDLGLIINTYSNVEQADRSKALAEMEAIQAKAQVVVQAVGSASAAVESGAQTVARAVEQTSKRATAASGASDEASRNVLSVAGAAEQLTASIGEIASRASRAAEIAREANDATRKTDSTIQMLTGTAGSIGDVVGLISGIAAQTNLLALNATIEAARAGEAGKGFAVVASEVKSLAGQTARATAEITTQIKSMQEATRSAVQAIQAIGHVVEEMDHVAAAIAAAVEEQRASTHEIAGNVNRAALGTRAVADNIGGVGEAAQQSGEAAGRVLDVARDLAKQAALLAGAVDELIARSRAA